MKRTERIQAMEALLDESRQAVDELQAALARYDAVQAKIRELEAYYTSPLWQRDFAAWEEGKLPAGLKCGVLSEDAVHDLLTDNTEIKAGMLETVSRLIR